MLISISVLVPLQGNVNIKQARRLTHRKAEEIYWFVMDGVSHRAQNNLVSTLNAVKKKKKIRTESVLCKEGTKEYT